MDLMKKVKKSFACRSVNDFALKTEIIKFHSPKMGDVGIFKVLEPKGNVLVDSYGSPHNLFENDLIMVAFGNRYATNQYEGYVPNNPVTKCELLARGGVAGSVCSINSTFKSTPASLELVAYAVDEDGQVINTIQKEKLIAFSPMANIFPKIILSIGTSMDSGKTTTAAYLCGGLKNAGHQVSFIKLTGTAYPRDARLAEDRGADFATDFSAFGYPSTYMIDYNELLNLYQTLIHKTVNIAQPEYIVMEIADGLLQRETKMLLQDSAFMSTVHNVIFSSGDSLGVLTGLQMLNDWRCAPFAISGLFTASELLIKAVEPFVDAPVLRLTDLLNGKAVEVLQACEPIDEMELIYV
jgi:hypothetical protein